MSDPEITPTVAGLAEVIEVLQQGRQRRVAAPILPVSRQEALPLSFAQQRLWILDQFEPGSCAYNMPFVIRLKGDLKREALERSLGEIVRRHEALRTTFVTENDQPVQSVSPMTSFVLPVEDLMAVATEQREAEARKRAQAEAMSPFDLAAGPLMRARLLKLDAEEHDLLLTMHHIVSDGWSMGILFKELSAFYESFTTGKLPGLPELSIQYADFAIWQRQWLTGEVLDSQLRYWKQQLEGAPAVLELPTDRPRPAVQTYWGERQSLSLSPELSEGLKRLSRAEGVTLYMKLLVAFQILLYRYTGQEDIVVGTPIANRTRTEIEGLIGFFVNTLVLRTDLSGDPTFRELLRRVRSTCLEAYAHQDLPFEKLVEELHPQRNLNRTPLFQVMFVLQNTPLEAIELAGLQLSCLDVEGETSKFDLTLTAVEENKGTKISISFNRDLFDTETIERMLGHYQVLLEGVVATPDGRISRLPLLAETERQLLLKEWNATEREYPRDKCIHQLFEEQVERMPEAVAVVFEDHRLTYRELNQKANQLAHYLRKRGVGPEVLVGICMERSTNMIVTMLGILKAGGAYVPLDPSYPKERLAFIMGDAQIPVLLAGQELAIDLPCLPPTVVFLDTDWDQIALESTVNPNSGVQYENLAYVIYTSGSTGRPKGVKITHQNVVRLLRGTESWFHFDHHDVWTLFHSCAFDFSVWEIYGPLLSGGRLVVVPFWVTRSPRAFYEFLQESQVTVLNQTPSAFRQLVHEVSQSADILKPARLRTIIFGGEALDFRSLTPWVERYGAESPQLVNMYGITETTVHVTYRLLTSDDWSTHSRSLIGRQIPDLAVYILDQQLEPVPVGVAGEIYVAGAGLCRGYHNRPDLTAERLLPNPFDEQPGGRLYKTGDRARYLSNGDIEYLGRTDHQVKIRGFRIECGEIETTLNTHAAVREAVVVAREDSGGEKRLVAYVVGKQELPLAVKDLRSFLKQKLPDYMVPSSFVFLDQLPLTPSGKVDRRALPAPDPRRSGLERSFVGPGNLIEEMLASIWAEVLKLDRVGIEDNFFELGGHSLLATRVVSRVREAFQVEIPMRSLFEAPTVAGLAEVIEVLQQGRQRRVAAPILPVSRQEALPLSFAQQRLWILDQFEPGSCAYNMPFVIRLKGDLKREALERSLGEIVRRHEALRTTFVTENDQPVQSVSPMTSFVLPVEDLMAVATEQREAEARKRAQAEAMSPFDLAAGPLMRARLLKLDAEEHDLLLTMHHIVSDGWSMGILFKELSAFYESFTTGKLPGLPELSIQYADFAIWQRQWLTGEVLDSQLRYWKQQLEGAPAVLELPTDRPRPAVQTYRGERQSLSLSPELSEGLKRLSRAEGVTLYMKLLAAFQILLYRYTGQEDIVVGTPIANRTRTEIEGLIGFFVNTLVLRTDLSGDPTFRELLRRVRSTCLEAYAHQDLPFEKLVEELHPQRNLNRTPLFQVMFVLQNTPQEAIELAGLQLSCLDVEGETSKFDLTLTAVEENKGTKISISFNRDLFDTETIERMLGHYQVLLEGVVATPDGRISRLPLLAETERQLLLKEWNATEREYPRDKCIHQLFEEQVERMPEAVAVVFEDHRLTYRELNQKANQLAHYLRKRGVGPEVLVGICMERSTNMIVAMLGILKAGGAYVPLDPEYPKERQALMLEDIRARVLLTEGYQLERLPEHRAETICLDRDWNSIAGESDSDCGSSVHAANLAYVIYTSGSTGIPKGIVIPHRAVNRLVLNTNYVKLGLSDCVAQVSNCSFDAATFEIWGALLQGACLVGFTKEAVLSPQTFVAQILEQKVSTMFLTTALFNQLASEVPMAFKTLHNLLIGGEAMDPRWTREVLCHGAPKRLLNAYGPTESTTFASFYLVQEIGDGIVNIPIGRPISNTQIYLLDSQLRPVPVGLTGELYIGGDGLARCYLNRADLTAENFIPHPFTSESGSRLYKTGDLACYQADGNIEFRGRVDHQVKIRGFRIECGEIETTLNTHAAVREAVVVAREDSGGEKRLVAYVVRKPGQSPTLNDLRSFLKQKLPDYMVPAAFLMLDKLPLTPNGKVDRKALPGYDSERPDLGSAFVSPRTPSEELLSRIWCELLELNEIGVEDNFFELGGHSLLAIQVISRVREAFRVEMPLRSLFEAPTVAELALAIVEKQTEQVGETDLNKVLAELEEANPRQEDSIERTS